MIDRSVGFVPIDPAPVKIGPAVANNTSVVVISAQYRVENSPSLQ